MPLMVFWIQMGLGILVTLAALFTGPDPLENWTGIDIGAFAAAIAAGWIVWRIAPVFGSFFAQTYNAVGLGLIAGFLVLAISQGWRVLGVICAAVALFGILLEKGGFFVALTATIVISAFADRDHRPLGVALMTVFLLALCWWVFISQLDIRVNMWPTS
jgi:predicted cation transporter